MPANVSVEYTQAEKEYYLTKTDEERLLALEKMIRTMPKHKSAEAMRANLRTRYKALQKRVIEKKKSKKGKPGIKKSELQAVLIGFTGSGKSSILASLTNANPKISEFQFTTKDTFLGTIDNGHVKIQLVDMPAIDYETFDSGVANMADTLLIVITNPNELSRILTLIEKTEGKQIIILNKVDLLSEIERRRFIAQLQSRKYNFIVFSAKTKENLAELKEKIWLTFNKLRVYTKEPGRKPDENPVIMPPNSTVKAVADKIFHGLADSVKETRVTGPSSKFPGQKVGLSHILKDKDIVEFRTA
jgi:ribosome-interacting GTPase 1